MLALRQYVLAALALALPAGAPDASAAETPDPLAILRKECVNCHTEAKRKGGLLIHSRESLLQGGDTDAAIVPGKAKESLLIEVLFPDAEMHMPPKGQLDPRQIAALEQWIDAGAPWDEKRWVQLNLPEKTEVTRGILPETYAPILALALSPDRKILAAGRGDTIDWYRVVPADPGKAPAFRLESFASTAAHDDLVQSLAFSPDGKRLVSGGFRSVRFWDPAAPQKPVREITAPFLGRQTALLFLDGGKRLLVADSVPTQIGRLHDITLDPESVKTFDTAHRDSIFTLTLSADGKRYASTSADKLIVVRDTTKHEVVKRLEGHTGYVLAAAFSPDGGRLASGGDDEEIKVWNLETGKKVGSFASNRSGPLYGLTWLVDPANGKRKAEEKDKKKAEEINTDLIVSIPESGKPSAFTELKEHEGEQRSTGAKERPFESAGTPLFALAFDRESLWSFAGGEDGKLRAWDDKGKLVQTLEAPVPAPAPAVAAPSQPAPAASVANPTPNPVVSANE
jgi:WD40 repeat protein/mono/diheme cytochrome c family protein